MKHSLFAVIGFGLLFLTGRAETLTWANTAGGSWSQAVNWSPNKVPIAADTAQITTPGTYLVTIDTPASVTQLTVGAASGTQSVRLTPEGSITLTGAGSFKTNTAFDWNGGTLAGAGTFNFAGTVTLTGAGDRAIDTTRITTTGTTT